MYSKYRAHKSSVKAHGLEKGRSKHSRKTDEIALQIFAKQVMDGYHELAVVHRIVHGVRMFQTA